MAFSSLTLLWSAIVATIILCCIGTTQQAPVIYSAQTGPFRGGIVTTSGTGQAWATPYSDMTDGDDNGNAVQTTAGVNGDTQYITVTSYGFDLPTSTCTNCLSISNIQVDLKVDGNNCGGGADIRLSELNLVTGSGPKLSTTQSDSANACNGPRIITKSLSPTGWGNGFTYNEMNVTTFGVRSRFRKYNKSPTLYLYYMKMTLTWQVTTSASSVTPSTIRGKSGSFRVTGSGFVPLPGATPKCRVTTQAGSVITDAAATILSATQFNCPSTSVPTYGTYQVSISLDGTTYTTDSVSLTFVCDYVTICANHGTCDFNQVCTCNQGWALPNCNTIDCSWANNCNNHGTCQASQSDGSGVCVCNSGYKGTTCDTFSCSSCVHGTCTGPNTCTCSPGWSGSNCNTPTCTNKDNCNAANGGGTCTAPDTCTCNSGFTTTSNCYADPSTCQPCPASGHCAAPGNCQCAPGYVLPYCNTTYSCVTCNNKGFCSGNNICTCQIGWKGNDCSQPDCSRYNDCSGNGICSPTTAECQCGTGWSGSNCTIPDCSSVNNCNGVRDGGRCISPQTCQCNPGWDLVADCSLAKCVSPPCGNNGTCIAPNTCECPRGFFNPPACDQSYNCTVLSDCNPIEGGVCVSDNTCRCFSGWLQPDCLSPDCSGVNNCTDAAHGTCVKPNTCACLGVYQGADCSAEPLQVKENKGGFPVPIVAGVAGGGGGAILLLSALGVIIYFKKIRPRSYRFKEPLYYQSLYGKYINLQYSAKKADIQKLKPLEELLLAPGLVLASAMATTIQATEKERVSRSLVYYFSFHKMTYALLLKLINIEVEHADGEGTLFRANSMAIALFQVYSKIIGLRYIWDTLGGFITELNALSEEAAKKKQKSGGTTIGSAKSSLVSDSLEMEIDPHKMESGESAINKYKLLLTTQKLFQVIVDSADTVPNELRGIFHHVSEKVVACFPQSKYKAVGAFMFLRFIVPCITSPHIYGLMPVPPNEQTQRNLVLLAKVLQNLANEVQFGAKEPHMQRLNDFIVENQDALHRFFDAISAPPSEIEDTLDIPEEVWQNGLLDLHNYLFENLNRVVEGLNNVGEVDTARTTQELVSQLGEPLSVKKV